MQKYLVISGQPEPAIHRLSGRITYVLLALILNLCKIPLDFNKLLFFLGVGHRFFDNTSYLGTPELPLNFHKTYINFPILYCREIPQQGDMTSSVQIFHFSDTWQ